MIQQTDSYVLREPAILTTSYVESGIIQIEGKRQLSLELKFTIGSLTNAKVQIHFKDGDNWRTHTVVAASAGVVTLSLAELTLGATGTFDYMTEVYSKFMKVSAKGTGTVTDSSLGIIAHLS